MPPRRRTNVVGACHCVALCVRDVRTVNANVEGFASAKQQPATVVRIKEWSCHIPWLTSVGWHRRCNMCVSICSNYN